MPRSGVHIVFATSRNGATSNPTLKNFFHKLTQHLLQNHQKCQIIFFQRINNKIASCQAGSRSFWSMAKVVSQNFCQSSFPPLRNNSDASSITPSSKANLFASVFASNSNLDYQGVQPHHFPPSKFTMSPIKFSTRKVRQTLLQLDTSKSKGPDGIPAIVLKTCAPELAPILSKLFQLSYTLGTFPTSWKQAHVFHIPKKVKSLFQSTIVPLQSLHSSLKQWRRSSLNNFLPSLKQTIFSLITSMAFEKPGKLVIFLLMLSIIGLVVSSLTGQLPSEWMASSPICTLSMLVYLRALSSPLYSSSSSSMTCSPPRLLAFTPLLMIPS